MSSKNTNKNKAKSTQNDKINNEEIPLIKEEITKPKSDYQESSKALPNTQLRCPNLNLTKIRSNNPQSQKPYFQPRCADINLCSISQRINKEKKYEINPDDSKSKKTQLDNIVFIFHVKSLLYEFFQNLFKDKITKSSIEFIQKEKFFRDNSDDNDNDSLQNSFKVISNNYRMRKENKWKKEKEKREAQRNRTKRKRKRESKCK